MNDMTEKQPGRFRSRRSKAVAAALLLAGGAAGGALAMQAVRPQVSMAPATPTAIRALSDGIVTVRGRAVELFGNKVVLEDPTGRALVDLGRQGEDGGLVGVGQTVTAQGRFAHGFIHAAFLVGADGKVRALGPLDEPHRHGPGGPGRPDGPREPREAVPTQPAPASMQTPAD